MKQVDGSTFVLSIRGLAGTHRRCEAHRRSNEIPHGQHLRNAIRTHTARSVSGYRGPLSITLPPRFGQTKWSPGATDLTPPLPLYIVRARSIRSRCLQLFLC